MFHNKIRYIGNEIYMNITLVMDKAQLRINCFTIHCYARKMNKKNYNKYL